MHETDGEDRSSDFSNDVEVDEFFVVRNAVLHASMEHGATGPESEKPFTYWLVEDCLYDETQIMEVVEPRGWRKSWLDSILSVTKTYPSWKVIVSCGESNSIVLIDGKFSTRGELLSGLGDLEEIVEATKQSQRKKRDDKAGILDFKHSYLHGKLQAAMQRVDENGCHYIATFSSTSECSSVCMLVNHSLYESFLEGGYAGNFRAVDSTGAIRGEFDREFYPYTEIVPQYWVVEFSFDGPAKETTRALYDVDDKEVRTLLLDNIVNLPPEQ